MYILKTHWYRNNWCVFLKFGKEDVMERVYIAIDLKSFYASVECVEREPKQYVLQLLLLLRNMDFPDEAGFLR